MFRSFDFGNLNYSIVNVNLRLQNTNKTVQHSENRTITFGGHIHSLFVARVPGGYSLEYGLYRYVRPQRVWFFGCFGHRKENQQKPFTNYVYGNLTMV